MTAPCLALDYKAALLVLLDHGMAPFSGRIRMYVRAEDAEDVYQAACLCAWRGIGKFRGTCTLSTWFHAILRNAALTIIRRTVQRSEVQVADNEWREDFPTDAVSIERLVLGKEMLRRVHALKPKESRAILHWIEGNEHPSNTEKQRAFRGIRRIRQKVLRSQT